MGTFPIDHEFPQDYIREEEDEVDIYDVPLFEEELSNQAQATKKRQSKRAKAYTKDEYKLLCEYMARERHLDRGERPSRTKRTSVMLPQLPSMPPWEGMMRKKNTHEEKRRQDKEEQINAFMKIQRKRLELDAEKQAKMLEMQTEKQAKMLEIEAINGKTKTKQVTLASMMTGLEIMKVDLSTVSLRKRPWFEKMQVNMPKFDNKWSMMAENNTLWSSCSY
ncbi:Protein UXT-like protein [Hordeum vulgare]|nr:Protein UXT-like protein [Hordeum vulgare]